MPRSMLPIVMEVTITDDDKDFCFEIKFGELIIELHAREIVELQRKLGLAIMDWISYATWDSLPDEYKKEIPIARPNRTY